MKISIFNNVKDTIPKEYDLDKWLKETINPSKRLLGLVNGYRNTHDKDYKKNLPCVTISASFKGVRNEENIKQKNNFIVLDIDRYSKKGKCNSCIDMLLVKEMFMNHPCTYYCGYSVSNDGVYAIIKLYENDKLDEYFNHFQKKLSRIGVNIDGSCKDYTRLRFFSYDSEAYYNPDALMYKLPIEVKTEVHRSVIANKSDEDKVQKVVEIIESNSIDITGSYDDWIKIGAAIYNSLGESGRPYFHRISKISSDYKYKECDSKYTNCSKMNKISLGTLFEFCKHYGIRY